MLPKKHNMRVQHLVAGRTGKKHKILMIQCKKTYNSVQEQTIQIEMLESFREKEINIIWSEWEKEIHKHRETSESLKCQTKGIALYFMDNGKLFGNMWALSKLSQRWAQNSSWLWRKRPSKMWWKSQFRQREPLETLKCNFDEIWRKETC